MVEEDAAGGVEAVALAVVDGDPVAVELGHAVGAPRVERRRLLLRRLHHLAVHLGAGGLVEADLLARVVLHVTNRLEQAERAHGGDVGGVGRLVEAHADVALGGEVVDLLRADLTDQSDQTVAVRQVAIVQMQLRLLAKDQVLDSLRAEGAGATTQAMHLVALREQQLREVGTVLTRDTRDQGTPLHR